MRDRVPSGPTGGAGRARRRALVVLATAAAVVGAVGCGDAEEDRFRAAAENARTSTTTTPPATEVPAGPGNGEPSATTAPSTTAPTDPGAALLAAVDALRASAGPGRALRFTTHFPVGGAAYASLQSQDPANPADIDERDWRDGRISQPEPVRLSPADDLAAELFDMGAIDWPAVAAALPAAPGLVSQQLGRPLDGSDGVTHLIVESGRPFTDGTVVRVYVDGGDRTTGGYVQLRPDGTLDKVMA
ncbi:hypothetical protein [Dermatobacter hominis]|uniref:hypothetical protein n=1 Tax=Dermatobacter hominis TaxID=2884263 RepID=UPI001D119635|nr:hypothetical protein [Dermatobacter hominis]UDY34592.1 hypothetical protein LH044_14765 [Dermatobacter hominis]